MLLKNVSLIFPLTSAISISPAGKIYSWLANRFVRQQHRNEIMRLLNPPVNIFITLASYLLDALLF